MKSDSFVWQFSPVCSEIATVLADLGLVTSAKATEIVESRMAKRQDKIKAKVVETVAETVEDAVQTRYSDSS